MDETQAEFGLLNALEQQTQFAIFAANDLRRALVVADVHRTWYALHSLIHVAVVVSLLLWPEPKKTANEPNEEFHARKGRYQERARRVRELLAVGDDSPLHARNLRHSVEHLDERVHAWADALDAKTWVHHVQVISNYADLDRSPWPDDTLQAFDGERFRLRFADKVFDITDIAYRLERLNTRVRPHAHHRYEGADISRFSNTDQFPI